MATYTSLSRNTLSAVMAAAIAGSALVGMTAATASAKPREVNCLAVAEVIEDSYNLAEFAREQGDVRGYAEHLGMYIRASNNYDRYCLG